MKSVFSATGITMPLRGSNETDQPASVSAPVSLEPPRSVDQACVLSLVVPFYNEEEVVRQFFSAVTPVLESIPSIDFEIICVNDGSRDRTLALLTLEASRDSRIRVIDLSRNFGKEAALTAGLDEAGG